MLRNWTFGRKVGTAFAVSVLALAIIAVVGYRSIGSLIDNDEWVAHTHEVRRALQTLLVHLVDAETGQRGFLITGKDDFLEPYTRGTAGAEKAYGELRRLTADNPTQQRRLDALRPIIDDRLAHLRTRIDERRATGSLEASTATMQGGEGKRLMDQLRAVIAEMDAEEVALLDGRARAAASTAASATSIMLWGSLGALLVTIALGVLITRSLTAQIGAAVRNIQSSSTELQSASTQQASGAREQSSAMTEISTTLSELLATSRQIAESAQRVSQIAAQTATSARSGDTTVTRGNDAIAMVRRQVDMVVAHMLELGKRSQQVGNVLEIVAELAEQTNILAINATIEAAGAGETGLRFGVVADEIRKLADRVGASTKEIRGMVDDVRSAVNTTVMATEAGSKAVDVGSAEVTEMAVAFRQIASLVVTTTDAVREIELSTKQQSTAVEQVNVAISQAAQATRDTATSAGQTLQTSSQLATLSTELLRLVQTQAG